MVVAAFLGTWAGTQYLAHCLGYHDNLGPILYRLPSQFQGLVSGAALACSAGAVALLRSGKGVSAAIPNLLDYPGSVLVVDVKPENAAVTNMTRDFSVQMAETAGVR